MLVSGLVSGLASVLVSVLASVSFSVLADFDSGLFESQASASVSVARMNR
ncbi:MAG: hypothetical protein HC927_04780 [Deltaproteobacteria bacterium]|nr:hypothetical protein [Deltaproteobacteria bacterium]